MDGVWRPPTRKILFMLRLVTLHLLVLAAALSLWMLLAISMKHLVLQSLMAVQSLHFARCLEESNDYGFRTPFHSLKPL
jgi:hypothetical protein